MPLNKANLETASKLLVGLAQRHDVIFNLAQKLSSGAVWVSKDGKLEIPFSEEERRELESFIDLYLQEAEVIAATLRSYLGDKPE